MTNGWPALLTRARHRHGVVSVADAVACGVPTTTFYRRVRHEQWVEVFPGVWLLPGAVATREARLRAAVMTSGSDSALSHRTALQRLGLDHRAGSGPIEVVRPYGRRADRVAGLVRHRSRALDQTDVSQHLGLPTTTAARTLMDVAASVPAWRLEAMMIAARQRGLLAPADGVHQHQRRPGLRGARTFLVAGTLMTADPADSILERRARRLLDRHGLHPVTEPFPVVCGDRTLHVDIAFPEHGFGIECDGRAYHDDDAFERDRARWRRLQDVGWRLTWLTWKRLHVQPTSFLAEVRRAVAP